MVRIREALIKAVAVSTAIASFFGLVYFSWRRLFISIFSREAELVALGSEALRIMVIMFPLVGAQIVFSIYFQVTGKQEDVGRVTAANKLPRRKPCRPTMPASRPVPKRGPRSFVSPAGTGSVHRIVGAH